MKKQNTQSVSEHILHSPRKSAGAINNKCRSGRKTQRESNNSVSACLHDSQCVVWFGVVWCGEGVGGRCRPGESWLKEVEGKQKIAHLKIDSWTLFLHFIGSLWWGFCSFRDCWQQHKRRQIPKRRTVLESFVQARAKKDTWWLASLM